MQARVTRTRTSKFRPRLRHIQWNFNQLFLFTSQFCWAARAKARWRERWCYTFTMSPTARVDVQTPQFGDWIRYCAMAWALVAFSMVLFRLLTTHMQIASSSSSSWWQKNSKFGKRYTVSSFEKLFTKVKGLKSVCTCCLSSHDNTIWRKLKVCVPNCLAWRCVMRNGHSDTVRMAKVCAHFVSLHMIIQLESSLRFACQIVCQEDV